MPTVSVALCTYNAGPHLLPQVQSIFDQSLLPDELVISDDGSTDDTLQNLHALQSRAPFPIRIHASPGRLGPAKNFEFCLSKCTSDFLFLCDQDDLWLPAKIKSFVNALSQNPTTLLAFSDLSLITSSGQPLPGSQWARLGFTPALQSQFSSSPFELLLRQSLATGAATAFKRSLLTHAAPFPPDFLHDEWLALIAAAQGSIALLPEPFTAYRQHTSQQVGAAPSGFFAQALYAATRMKTPYFQAQLRRADSLLARLQSLPATSLHPNVLSLAQEKRNHARTRLQMRESFLKRWPLAFQELTSSNYTRFALGYKSFLQDLFF